LQGNVGGRLERGAAVVAVGKVLLDAGDALLKVLRRQEGDKEEAARPVHRLVS
jgi:hypothetical protein